MTPPMPTDETPSAGAVAKANAIRLPFLARGGISDIDGLRDATALALDAFARERERSRDRLWADDLSMLIREIEDWTEINRSAMLSRLNMIRTRAAEARRTR